MNENNRNEISTNLLGLFCDPTRSPYNMYIEINKLLKILFHFPNLSFGENSDSGFDRSLIIQRYFCAESFRASAEQR